MKEIIANSKIYGKKIVLIDDEDYEYLSKYNWHLCRSYNIFYAVTNIDRKKIRMHRLIYSKYFNLCKKEILDHKDKNGLNNQKYNLRKCSKSQNGLNTITRKTNSSGYKGVYKRKYLPIWTATITKNYKIIYIGNFRNPIDAARAYDKKAKELFGEFAQLNFNE